MIAIHGESNVYSSGVIGTDANGCLEINILDLIIYTSTISTVIDTVCDSYTWGVNGQI